jgi:hypothetical protein
VWWSLRTLIDVIAATPDTSWTSMEHVAKCLQTVSLLTLSVWAVFSVRLVICLKMMESVKLLSESLTASRLISRLRFAIYAPMGTISRAKIAPKFPPCVVDTMWNLAFACGVFLGILTTEANVLIQIARREREITARSAKERWWLMPKLDYAYILIKIAQFLPFRVVMPVTSGTIGTTCDVCSIQYTVIKPTTMGLAQIVSPNMNLVRASV